MALLKIDETFVDEWKLCKGTFPKSKNIQRKDLQLVPGLKYGGDNRLLLVFNNYDNHNGSKTTIVPGYFGEELQPEQIRISVKNTNKYVTIPSCYTSSIRVFQVKPLPKEEHASATKLLIDNGFISKCCVPKFWTDDIPPYKAKNLDPYNALALSESPVYIDSFTRHRTSSFLQALF